MADPNRVPLGAPGDGVVPDFTPPFPAYISGHSTFGTHWSFDNINGQATGRSVADYVFQHELRGKR